MKALNQRVSIFILCGALLFSHQAIAFKYYWVGGSGNWSDYSVHWAGVSGGVPIYSHIPYATDTVYFDANSFSAPFQKVVLDSTIINCADMIWAGVTNSPVLDGPSSSTLKIYGSLVFDATMSITFNGPVSFEANKPGMTITSAGKIFNNSVTFNGIGGAWTLMDVLTVSSSFSIYLNNGTLNTNDKSVNAYSFLSLSSTAREINMGSSVINLSSPGGASPAWRVTRTGMSVNCGTSTINCIKSASALFDGGSFIYNDLIFSHPVASTAGGIINCSGPCTFHDVIFRGKGSITSDGNSFHTVIFIKDGKITSKNNRFNAVFFDSTGVVADNNNFKECIFYEDGSITGANIFDTLTFSPGRTYTLAAGKTQTIGSTWNATGTGSFPIRIQSSIAGNPSTISKAAGYVCTDFVLLSDNIATGGALFNAGANSADYGGNSGWNFPGSCSPPVASFGSSNTLGCTGDCINYFDQSTNATSWKWSFTGGSPSGSSVQDPQNICYSTPGIYKVMLVATNVIGSDTLSVVDYITIHAPPPPPLIIQSHDTLYCQTNPSYTTYQWYIDSILIEGATDTLYVIAHSGNYNVMVTNEYSCKIATGINVVGVKESSAADLIAVSPNPATNFITLHSFFRHTSETTTVSILNMIGEEVTSLSGLQKNGMNAVIDISNLPKGMYLLEIKSERGVVSNKFIKE